MTELQSGLKPHIGYADPPYPGQQAWDEWCASILGEPEQLVMTHD